MITITEGMTPAAFLEAVNYNFLPADTPLTSVMVAADFKTNYDANYDANKVTFPALASKSALLVGMTAAAFVAALNANTTKINTQFTATYPYSEESYVVPNTRMSAYLGVWNYVAPAVLKLANGKTLISGLSRGGNPLSRECFTIKRNIDGTYTAPALLGHDESTTGTYDAHGRAVFVEKAGVIYGFHEALVGVSETWANGHNSAIVVVKSIDGGDTWTEISRFGELLGYPQAFIIGTDLYCFARYTLPAAPLYPKYIAIYKSTNDGINWTEVIPFIGTTDTDYRAYSKMPDDTTGEINIAITPRILLTGQCYVWNWIMYIRSTDGITYYNSTRTWSKDVVTNGAITSAEAITNCAIVGNADNNHSFIHCGSFMKDDKLYTLIAGGDQLDFDEDGFDYINLTSLKIYENQTALVDLSSLVTGKSVLSFDQTFILMRDNNIFSVLEKDILDNNDLKIHSVGLSGVLSTTKLKDGVVDIWGQFLAGFTYGSNRITGRSVVVLKNTGDLFNDLSYGDLIVFNNI